MTLALRNANIVLPDRTIFGSLTASDEVINAVDEAGSGSVGIDCEGDYIIAGLVELHTDQLENHYRPRPGVFWEPMAALQSHDAQIAASGITTVFDAVRLGSDPDLPEMHVHIERMLTAIRRGREDGRLRAEHFVHLRCELPSSDVVEHFEAYADHESTQLASLMDHTPGQRQFRSVEAFRRFYAKNRTPEELDAYVEARLEEQRRYSADNRAALVSAARQLQLPLASHDDTTLEHVEQAVADSIDITEFPTTLEAAAAAHSAGLAVLMGAPNVVRGRSHSGNISALDLAAAGLLDVLSSDYVPFALMQAAFQLPQKLPDLPLHAALAMVTLTPAEAAGLDDRGAIAPGKRADLVRVSLIDGAPVVRAVWRGGERIC
ncbi:phosphonate metabolism protein PhnM [Devosia pacifica]|uniref:Phosphonate metabolism protein PhnM n=1 Tax=Devosia pacifica TaxID=1335967 RepID=A0A918S4U2_9HYPH|nr:alpha-D-ribose 1-methylphosphonate 5-triphosphate diphosphatase [Devosia pacifica]GHA20600.1 phosphonate metabolism protein PhnM [Devosia pacifica]